MQVQVRFYKWDGRYWSAGPFPSLREAADRLGLRGLERDRHPDLPGLLGDAGVARAYTQTVRGGVWVAYAWKPDPPPPRGASGSRSPWPGPGPPCRAG